MTAQLAIALQLMQLSCQPRAPAVFCVQASERLSMSLMLQLLATAAAVAGAAATGGAPPPPPAVAIAIGSSQLPHNLPN